MSAREFAFTDDDFRRVASRVHAHMGIQLPEQKKDMVYSRLTRRLRALGLNSFAEYLTLVESDESSELENFANAITTNVTAFFREAHHFEHFSETVIPFVQEHNAESRRVRFWSAGCSAGMEAYSMALTLHAMMDRLDEWDVKILATDIDTGVLECGRKAEYDDRQLEKIPADIARGRIFHDAKSGIIRMHPDIQKLVHFKQLNLLEQWPMRGIFDAIFCRNVVIYFDKPTQKMLFDRYADVLRPGGWLYIGHSENLFHVCDRFKLVGNTIYEKVR